MRLAIETFASVFVMTSAMRHSRLLLLSLAVAAFGCSDDTGDGNGTTDAGMNNSDGQPATDGMVNTMDSGTPPDYNELIVRDWSIPPGSESYKCTRLTLQEDMYVTAFHGRSPLGTHHTVLSARQNSNRPDGDYDCDAGDIAHTMLFASGVGTDNLVFPEGVAIRLNAGDQLDLNLHLYNVSDATITGTSGTDVKLIPADDVVEEAEVVFGGQYAILLTNMPGVPQTIDGGCDFQQDGTVIALWPHMHQYGRHMKVTHSGPGIDDVLLDTAFSFEEQLNYPIDPVQVRAGERLDVECVYDNTSGSFVIFGDSSEAEMCFVGIYRYPATGAGTFDCVEIST